MIAYIALFSALLSRFIALAYGSTWVIAFYCAFFEYPPKCCTHSADMAGAIWNCSRLGASSVYTIQPCTTSLHAKPRKVYECLSVNCHLHFWQNDQGLLRATAVTRGWNGYRNKSQRRKSTLQKKIPPPLLQEFEPATVQSRVRRSTTTELSPPLFSVCERYEIRELYWFICSLAC